MIFHCAIMVNVHERIKRKENKIHTAGIDPSANISAAWPYVVDDGSIATAHYRSLLSRPCRARSQGRGAFIQVATTSLSHLEVIMLFSFTSSNMLYFNLFIYLYI